ncbi:MAG: RES family NAD+ phosphorylase [Anaeromyxobacteraceae bacterium]
MVESQQRISTRVLVDSDAEHELLEALIEESKPPVPDEAEDLDFLLFSPFRYPPLEHGSRFGRPDEPSLWYGSESVETALAEMAYYRLVFFEGTAADLLPNQLRMSAFRAGVASKSAVDLTAPPFDRFRDAITSRTDYGEPQQLGSDMRADGVELFRFPSARAPKQGLNVALFTPKAFVLKEPLEPSTTWTCTVTARRDVSWLREGAGSHERFEFPRAIFLVDGKLPGPAL